MIAVRPARAEDLPLLPGIERAAGEPFRSIGMPEIADDEPPSVDELAAVQRAGRAWVATVDGRVGGYLLLAVVDGDAHVEQVSADPAHRGRRLGRRLLDAAAGHAVEHGLPALTLTTFADVPWNAPYYARLGFRVLADAELTPGLRAVRAAEAARGLDRWPRVAMRRDLGPAADGGDSVSG